MGQQLADGIGPRRDQDSPSMLSAIVTSSDDAIVGKAMDGTLTSWNPGAERMHGYSAAVIVGQPITTLGPPDRVGEIKQFLAGIARGERVVHHRTERQREDGTSSPVSVTISPVYEEGGAPIGASSIARDITDFAGAIGALGMFWPRVSEPPPDAISPAASGET